MRRLIAHKFEYGWIVWVDPKLVLPDYKGYSPAFKALIKLAKYIKFDRKGVDSGYANKKTD